MLKALLFDFDGTIADTLPVCIGAFRKTVEPILGHAMSLDEIRSYFGPTEEGIFQKHFPDRKSELCETYFKHYTDLQREFPDLVPGIVQLIQDLKDSGVRIALITAKGEVSCKISLDFYGIADLFEFIRVGGIQGRIKDLAILEVLEKMGLQCDECAYVGDSHKDVVSSHKAGVQAWAAAWLPTADPQKILEFKPEKIFYSVTELRHCLKEEGVLA